MNKTIVTTITAMMLFTVSCGQGQPKAADASHNPDGFPSNITQADATSGTLMLEGFTDMGAGDMDGDENEETYSNPAPPPPDMVVGTWKAPTKRGYMAYLEIYEDGMAGLYLGDADSDQLYEIYQGTVLSVGDNLDEICMEMDFDLNWYIYESEDGAPIKGVPDSYKGAYTLRHYWDGDKQMLHLKANDGADPLFDKKELNMEWTPKTISGSSMILMVSG